MRSKSRKVKLRKRRSDEWKTLRLQKRKQERAERNAAKRWRRENVA
jgi:hypothetical protein